MNTDCFPLDQTWKGDAFVSPSHDEHISTSMTISASKSPNVDKPTTPGG